MVGGYATFVMAFMASKVIRLNWASELAFEDKAIGPVLMVAVTV
jgi:hypothetical protein